MPFKSRRLKSLRLFILMIGIIFGFFRPTELIAANPEVRLIKCDATQIILEIVIPPVTFRAVYLNGRLYEIPHIENFYLTIEPGQPRLPQNGLLLAIPPHSAYHLQILASQPDIIGKKPIPPAPSLQLPETEEKDTALFFDPTIYNRNEFYPRNWAEIESEVCIRDRRIIRLQINPVQYNPHTQEIIATRYLKVAIHFDDLSKQARPQTAPDRHANPLFESVFQKFLINDEPAKNWRVTTTSVSEHLKKAAVPLAANVFDSKYKIKINEAGIYRLSYEWLQQQGINVSQIEPRSVKIFNKGVEIPLRVQATSNERLAAGDYLEFFAEPNRGDSAYYNPYSDENVYWLTWGGNAGQRIRLKSSALNPSQTVTEYIQSIHLEEENIYHAGDTNTDIIDTEQKPGEGWVWMFLYGGDIKTIPFRLNHLNADNREATIRMWFHGTTTDPVKPDHHLQIQINQQVIGEIIFDDREDALFESQFQAAYLKNGENHIQIHSLGDLGAERDQVYLDWIELEVPTKLSPDSSALNFKMPALSAVTEYSIWDFNTDRVEIFEVNQGELIQPRSLRREQEFVFKVTSAGFNAGYLAKIEINGEDIINPGRRGINLVTVDPNTGQVIDALDFDTFASTAAADSLARLIQRLPEDTYALAGIRDEGRVNLTEAAMIALENIGSALIRQLNPRDSWAIIGRKGAEQGTVPEMLKPDGQGMATIADTVVLPNVGASFHLVFADSAIQPKHYFVVSPSDRKIPVGIESDVPSNWADSQHGADLIIITHRNFRESARRLADHRRQHNQLRVEVVFIDDIYDEFNFGLVSPHAIKAFLKNAYENWQPPAPFAVIFFGDASWDMKMNGESSVKINYVPSYGNPVSDNWFVCFTDSVPFLPDMVVGRIAVESDAAGQIVVDKIIAYDQLQPASWQKEVLFITGGFNKTEQNIFMTQSNQLNRDFVEPPPATCRGLMINKTTAGNFEGEKKPEILAALNRGKLWVNFLGHAGSFTWDLMFNEPDIEELTNSGKYPFITSMTCHTARFANPSINCFAELFVNTPQKGAIGFWGTSGWGFLEQDYQLLRKLFPTILADTVQALGTATQLAKIDLYQKYGAGSININSIHQYTLIGDPLTEIALSRHPELTVRANDIQLDPPLPVADDSVVNIKIKIRNWGLAPADSVEIQVLDFDEAQNVNPLTENLKLAPIGLVDSVIVKWPITGKAGAHRLEITVDPANKIQEKFENDNTQSLSVVVYASALTISKPVQYQVVNDKRTWLQVNSPIKRLSAHQSRLYEFELDTTAQFNSPAFTRETMTEGSVVTRWQTPELINYTTYFWRCRIISGEQRSQWVQSTFYVNFSTKDFSLRIKHPFQLSQMELNNTTVTPDGIRLKSRHIPIRVESGGMNDGNLARIYIDERLIMDSWRGYNVGIIDPLTGEVLHAENFDTWFAESKVADLVQLIQSIEPGVYVCAAIKDEGRLNLNESAYLALESIGSQFCRQISTRDSWAIIGIKGAPIGSVPEMHRPSGNGLAVTTDRLTIFAEAGTVTTPVIGSANSWYSLECFASSRENQSPVTHQIIGFNLRTARWDTLAPILTNESIKNLGFVDSTIYSKIKIRAHLFDLSRSNQPLFQGWRLAYRPVADLAINERVVRVAADSMIEGAINTIAGEVYNIGFVPADSFQINFYYQLPASEKYKIRNSTMISCLPPDSMKTISLDWNAMGNNQAVQLSVELDSADQVRELFDFNNKAAIPVFVIDDSSRPKLVVLFDGKEISDGSWVAQQPTIAIQIYDNNTSTPLDSSHIHIFLDEQRLSYLNNEHRLSILSNPDAQNPTLRTTALLHPQFSNGSHLLEVIVKDAVQNSSYFRKQFEVTSAFQMLDVMNYPNPFKDNTTFTYILTQAADRVNINIYTISGRLIRRIENAPRSIGFNHLPWDARDEMQDELANGVYLYKIIAFQNSKKIEKIEKLIQMK